MAEHTGYDGAYPEEVRRSSIVLQGLTYQPSGAVVAAATTSLPEELGGDLNFDYRFAWLRDLSLTVRSLWIAACPHEPRRLFDWFATAAGRNGGELVQIMYGVEGERDLTEHTLDRLDGYRGSRPVRVGNDAWRQKQLDVLGEVIEAAHPVAADRRRAGRDTGRRSTDRGPPARAVSGRAPGPHGGSSPAGAGPSRRCRRPVGGGRVRPAG